MQTLLSPWERLAHLMLALLLHTLSSRLQTCRPLKAKHLRSCQLRQLIRRQQLHLRRQLGLHPQVLLQLFRWSKAACLQPPPSNRWLQRGPCLQRPRLTCQASHPWLQTDNRHPRKAHKELLHLLNSRPMRLPSSPQVSDPSNRINAFRADIADAFT